MVITDFFKNILKKQKKLPLPEEVPSNETEAINKLNVFAEQDGKVTKKIIKININGNMIPIAEIKDQKDGPPLKDIAQAITRVIDDMQNSTGKEISITSKRRQVKQNLDWLSRTYGFEPLPELESVINLYLPYEKIDYRKLSSIIPKTADISKMTQSQVLDFGQILQNRLDILKRIKTPKDAEKNQDDIISFMKSQETEDPLGVIIAANIENINSENAETLDLNTILACTKRMNSFENEDALMYSSYLKLEEKRILKMIQAEIEGTRTEKNSEIVDRMLAEIESTKIGELYTETESSIVKFMESIRNERSIEKYVKETAKTDFRVKRYVTENMTPNANKISRFFASRIASLGQVTQIPEYEENSNVIPLRKVIEESDFKHPDRSESNEFLLFVAGIERNYILSNYSALLERYYLMIRSNNTLKER